MSDTGQTERDSSLQLSRRTALSLPAVGVGTAVIGAMIMPAAEAANSAPPPNLITPESKKLRALAAALAKAPRRRNYKSVPMILTNSDQWDSEALHILFTYAAGPKQIWDNTDLTGPWLNLMRNAMNAQIWSWKHPNFIAVSATHGSAHLALYDNYIWKKYLSSFTGGKFSSNIWIEEPSAASSPASSFNDPKGVFSPHDNSIVVLQRRGAVFCACHNEVWELTMAVLKRGINPDKLSHEQLAAEFTNHLIPGVILTPGIVGTIPEFELSGFQYAK
ncbi:transcriptional initiation protein Tat [Acidiphilium sp.]|uniref:thiosulfate dehydrogenase n=1 Tax=Acidiphilium sp. TaxID=527 RepID=UPI003D08D6DD